MSLSERITQSVKASGCRTCVFYDALPPGDQAAFDEWVAAGRPVEELRRLCVEEGLDVTETPFRTHIRDHRKAPRGTMQGDMGPQHPDYKP
jgi:hypothetical protein